jgi:hypothetical protein
MPRTLEELGKASGFGVALTYALGMLVVTLHQARYGVWPVEILKPRAFGAGVLFVSTWAMGAFMAAHCFNRYGFESRLFAPGMSARTEGLVRMAKLVAVTAAVGLGLSRFLFADNDPTGWNVRPMAVVVAAYLLYVGAAHVSLLRDRYRLALAILSMTLVAVGFWFWDRQGGTLVSWLWISGFMTTRARDVLGDIRLGGPEEIAVKGISLVVLIFFFTAKIYGNASPGLGGGFSPSVVIKMKKDSQADPSRPDLYRVYLLDENERGFYVLEQRSSQEVFWLPRELTTIVTYRPAAPAASDQSKAPAGGGPTAAPH